MELTKNQLIWVEQMKARVPAKLAAGMTMEQAVEAAHVEWMGVIAELAQACEGTESATRRAKETVSLMSEITYAKLRQTA